MSDDNLAEDIDQFLTNDAEKTINAAITGSNRTALKSVRSNDPHDPDVVKATFSAGHTFDVRGYDVDEWAIDRVDYKGTEIVIAFRKEE